MDFTGRTVWITGASSGIGRALAEALGARGAALVLSGRRREALAETASGIESTLVLPFEATNHASLPKVVEKAWGWRKGIDCLINNAGVSQRSLAIDTAFSVYRELMEVDFFAPVALTQALLPRMIERRSGRIVVVSSVAGKIGAPLRTGYCAAKHACEGYFEALRSEVELAYGIGVSVIRPGSIRTAISANALTASGARFGRTDANIENGMAPEAAAARVVAGLEADEREIVVAEGLESMALGLRASDPQKVFGMLGGEGARLAKERAERGAAFSPENTRFNTQN
jgi:short-subunit dehydrogenase